MNDTSLEPDDPPEAELIPESQLIDGEPAPELPGMTDYPWANGDAATMLRSFIFQTVCDAEIDIPNQMARMAARREGRVPDPVKWTKAVNDAFDRAVKRTMPSES
jgi:hypothetical protein